MIYPVGAQADNGFQLRARCSGTSATARLEVEADGTKDDGIFLAEVFEPAGATNTSPPGFPPDGDLDASDSFTLFDSTTALVSGVSVRYGERNVGADSGDVVVLQSVTRVKTSVVGAPIPTQGNCSFVGTAVTAAP